MRGRVRVVVGLSLALSIGAACVDLFHSTDFDTLCTLNPSACAAEAGGDGPVGVDAGIDVVVPDIDFCSFSPAQAREKAERTCAWLGACTGPRSGSSFGQCMLRALAAYDCNFNPTLPVVDDAKRLWACLVDVNSCERVEACLFAGRFGGCPKVDAGSFTACDEDGGANVVECGIGGEVSNPPQAVEPCVLEGRRCQRVSSGSAVCAGLGVFGPQCNAEAARCEGTNAMRCVASYDNGLNCAGYGAKKCVADDAGLAACAPLETAAASCTNATGQLGATCDDGGVATRCVAGKRAELRCGSVGIGCTVPMPEDKAATLDLLQMCKTSSGPSLCTNEEVCGALDGGVTGIQSCANTTLFTLDCAKVGLGPCKKGEAPKPPFVSCTKP